MNRVSPRPNALGRRGLIHPMLAPLPLTWLGPSLTGPIHEIDTDISQSWQELSTLPRCHRLRPICTYLLASHLLNIIDCQIKRMTSTSQYFL